MKTLLILFSCLLSLASAHAQTIVIRGPNAAAASVAGGGGGASAWSFVRGCSNVNASASVTNVQFGANITAGNAVFVWVGHEDGDAGLSSPSNVVERAGGTFTGLTVREQETGFLTGRWFYLLSATGGGVNIDIQYTNNASVVACRVIALEFDYGGTASFVTEGNNGADSGTSMTSASVSNSGTHRLNLCGYIGFDSATITATLIGGAAVTAQPTAQYGTAWVWYNAEQLSSENSSATRSASEGWILNLACFAAN